jgi:hypothetical protein
MENNAIYCFTHCSSVKGCYEQTVEYVSYYSSAAI